MAVRLLKGQTVAGKWCDRFDILYGLSLQAEELLKQGGGAESVNLTISEGPGLTVPAAAALQTVFNAGIDTQIKIGTWGDSRANPASSASALFDDQSPIAQRPSVVLATLAGNAELTFNGGLGGDFANNWNNASRAGGKTIAALAAAGVNALHFQFGINSVNTYTSGSTQTLIDSISADLRRNISALSTMVRRLYVESINPCTAAVYGATAVSKEIIRKAVNANLQAFCLGMPNVRFIDTDPLLYDPMAGAANAAYTDDGTHLNNAGSAAVASQYLLPAYLQDHPRLTSAYLKGAIGPNILDSMFSASTLGLSNDIYTGVNTGSGSFSSYAIGVDERGIYQQFVFTPTAVAGGSVSAIARIHARCAPSQLFAVAAGEKYRAGIRVYIDDGAGGAPNCQAVELRLRAAYSVASAKTNQFSSLNGGAGPSTGANPSAPIFLNWATVNGLTLNGSTADMEVADVSNSTRGFRIDVVTWGASAAAPYRVKLYAPAIARVA